MIVSDERRRDLTLKQRGRAGMQFLGSLQVFSSGDLRQRAKAHFAESPDAKALDEAKKPADRAGWQDRIERIRAIAERDPTYRFERLYQRYVAEENFVRGIAAIEDVREEAKAFLAKTPAPQPGSGSNDIVIELHQEVEEPSYHAGVEWHLQPGGWHSYDLSGPMFMAGIWPYVFQLGGWAAVELGDDVTDHREELARQLPKSAYRRVFDPCCGGVTTLMAVHKVFPEAELVGCDIEGHLLKVGGVAAARQGLQVRLIQADARDTGEPDGSVDAVVMQTALHEMPVEPGQAVLREMFRILEPGGDLVMNDIAPFHGLDSFQALLMDWETENRGEPYFREFCSWDRAGYLRDIGFVDVEEYPLRDSGYPWIIRARKPA